MKRIYIFIIFLVILFLLSLILTTYQYGKANIETSKYMNEYIDGENYHYYFELNEENVDINSKINNFVFYYDFSNNYGKISFKSRELKYIKIQFPKEIDNVILSINGIKIDESKYNIINESDHIKLIYNNSKYIYNYKSSIPYEIKYNSTIEPSGTFTFVIDDRTVIYSIPRNIHFIIGDEYVPFGNGIYNLNGVKESKRSYPKKIELSLDTSNFDNTFRLHYYNNTIKSEKNYMKSYGIGLTVASWAMFISLIISFLFWISSYEEFKNEILKIKKKLQK